MTKDKELKAVFLMMQELKSKVSTLESQVKALNETKTSISNCCEHCKEVQTVQDELKDLVNFQISETAKVEEELNLIDTGMDRVFHRTNDLQERQGLQGDKLIEVETRLKKSGSNQP